MREWEGEREWVSEEMEGKNLGCWLFWPWPAVKERGEKSFEVRMKRECVLTNEGFSPHFHSLYTSFLSMISC